jgi:hypothetical protein
VVRPWTRRWYKRMAFRGLVLYAQVLRPLPHPPFSPSLAPGSDRRNDARTRGRCVSRLSRTVRPWAYRCLPFPPSLGLLRCSCRGDSNLATRHLPRPYRLQRQQETAAARRLQEMAQMLQRPPPQERQLGLGAGPRRRALPRRRGQSQGPPPVRLKCRRRICWGPGGKPLRKRGRLDLRAKDLRVYCLSSNLTLRPFLLLLPRLLLQVALRGRVNMAAASVQGSACS